MTRKNISNAVSNIELEYIEKAADYEVQGMNRPSAWKKWGILAACLCLCALLGVGVWKSGLFDKKPIDMQPGTTTNVNYDTVEMTGMSFLNLVSPYKNDAEMFKAAKVVVSGIVKSTKYVLDGSTVYTASEVEVEECYKGNLKKGDSIKVKEMGGFVPANVHANAISEEKEGKTVASDDGSILDIRVEGNKVMEKGERVILFLVPVEGSSLDEFRTNSYETLRLWQGKLLYNEKHKVYAPYYPKEELSLVEARTYTADEFDAFANNIGK